jgi:hypothetical protein
MTAPDYAGWCARYGSGPPHWADLLLDTNIGPDVRLCQPCHAAWIRDDSKDTQ